MKIQHANLQLTSQYQLERSTWSGMQVRLTELQPTAFAQQMKDEIAALLPVRRAESNPEAEALSREKAKAQRFQSLWELLLGDNCARAAKTVQASPVSDPSRAVSALRPGAPSLSVLQMMTFEHTRESEQCSFAASGNVCLSDGRSRQFAVDYQLSRQTEVTRLTAAQATVLQDPLVLDFGVPTAEMGKMVAFDLNQDGQKEWMPMPSSTSAFLFLDRNRNGLADHGGELFGPSTGQGFVELACLDDDRNGWIDENDAAFVNLKLWQASAQGEVVQSLAQAGVGALALASASTEFSIQAEGAVLGQQRASSVWLGEHAGAGVVRQIDVATKAV